MDYKDKKIFVGIPCGAGFIPAQMVMSLLQLRKPCPCFMSVVERQKIVKCRNHFVQQALSSGSDYLLMIDDDNPIPPETLELLLEDDKDIVGATILSRNPNAQGIHDLCAFYSHEHEVGGKIIKLYDNIIDFKEKGDLHKVDGLGTGCILIKRHVLEEMSKVYKHGIFEETAIDFELTNINGKDYDRRTMSEDCEFSERAINCGFEV
jgi:hypothetical protein